MRGSPGLYNSPRAAYLKNQQGWPRRLPRLVFSLCSLGDFVRVFRSRHSDQAARRKAASTTVVSMERAARAIRQAATFLKKIGFYQVARQ